MLEEGYPADRVAFICQDCGCRLVIDSVVWEEILQCEPLEGHEEADDHDAAFAVYTSGSTGNPKGVLHEYGNLDRIAASMPMASRAGLVAPLYFIASLEIFIRTIDLGAILFVIPREVMKSPQQLIPCFTVNDIRETFCAPSIFPLFRQIPSLRILYVGSEPAYGIWSEDPKLEVYPSWDLAVCGSLQRAGNWIWRRRRKRSWRLMRQA